MNTLVRENRSNERRASASNSSRRRRASVENADGYTLQVEMPGVNKEGLEISVENNELTIIGRRSIPAIDGTILHRESRAENFRRAFEIDPSIDTGKISAKIEQGVVTLHSAKSGAGEAAQDHSVVIAGLFG